MFDFVLTNLKKNHLIVSSSTTDTVSLSAFAYLYSELVQYHQNNVDSISELERRLESSGFGVGLKVLELMAYRQREVSFIFAKYKGIRLFLFFFLLLLCDNGVVNTGGTPSGIQFMYDLFFFN